MRGTCSGSWLGVAVGVAIAAGLACPDRPDPATAVIARGDGRVNQNGSHAARPE